MALVTLLLAVPTVIMDLRLPTRPLSYVPERFDRFLNEIRASTPSGARVLVLNPFTDPHRYMYYRCVYKLYPRTVSILRVLPSEVRGGVVQMTWSYALYAARLEHADYIVLWARPAPARGHPRIADPSGWSLPTSLQGRPGGATLRVHAGWGTLARVAT
jgi:hypothetical protein